MSYKPYYTNGWKSGEAGGTPITPEALNHMESGIQNAATYAKKVGAPYNLLDNSDWSNPINQRGKGEYTTQGYVFDRWFVVGSLKTIISSGCVILANTTESTQRIVQKIPMNRFTEGKTYTLAVRTKNGNVFCGSAVLGTSSTTLLSSAEFYVQFLIFTSDNTMMLELRQRAGFTTEYVNIALYEGEYTAETLPEYQPKGYAVELAACRQYFRRAYGAFVAGFVTGSRDGVMLCIDNNEPFNRMPTLDIQSIGWVRGGGKNITDITNYTITAYSSNNAITPSYSLMFTHADLATMPVYQSVLVYCNYTLSADL